MARREPTPRRRQAESVTPNVVDSSGWLEYVDGGPNAQAFEAAILAVERLVVPTICLLEVFKRMLREKGEDAALDVVGQMRQGLVVDLDADLALEAARLGIELKLPLADSAILATARCMARPSGRWTSVSRAWMECVTSRSAIARLTRDPDARKEGQNDYHPRLRRRRLPGRHSASCAQPRRTPFGSRPQRTRRRNRWQRHGIRRDFLSVVAKGAGVVHAQSPCNDFVCRGFYCSTLEGCRDCEISGWSE